ncbi:MAG TPA: NAD(P)H-binding protein [Kofleriaceae bacterium]|nr:NAD(P)H-binding protein [Kofleriaceae bacterium]
MITVFGASGNVGRELVAMLRAGGHPVRVVTRQERGPGWGDGVERVVGDLGDPATVARALDGADRLFWTLLLLDDAIDDRAIVRAAQRAGVRHVVLLSSIGATMPVPIGRHHREREEWLEQSGLAWTMLRPGYFMSNALQWAGTIASAGRVMTPMPDGPTAPIAPRDIAEVAALALTRPGHEGAVRTLTGDELLSTRDQVEVLARALGRPIEVVEMSMEAAAEALRRAGRPDWIIESHASMWKEVRAGRAGRRTDTFAALTGHAPQRFAAWCEAHRAAFAGTGPAPASRR